MFDILSFIEKKREGLQHQPEDLECFIRKYQQKEISDYQVAAWLMAVFFKGMSREELRAFTLALAHSGSIVRLPHGIEAVDKHSTGGVGDKTTLAVVPIVASCGVPVAKLSGRGLGFTGGTVDKLESIEGFRIDLSMSEFADQIEKIGCAIAGHSQELAPAEALFYELRDVTATVPSLPLICSSILSKKIAGGASSFVFDVKCGRGAFMNDLERARVLAKDLVALSVDLGYRSTALITNMEQPLGEWVGNAAEVMEAVSVLKGEGPVDTEKLCIDLAGEMISNGGKTCNSVEGAKKARLAISSGRAFEKMIEMVKFQGGNPAVLEKPSNFIHIAKNVKDINAQKSGFVTCMDARAIGEAVRRLGGGRVRKEDEIDRAVAVRMIVKLGDWVEKGSPLLQIYYSDTARLHEAWRYLFNAASIGEERLETVLIHERVG